MIEIVFPGGRLNRITAKIYFAKNMAVLHDLSEKHNRDRVDAMLYAADAMIESLKKGDMKQTTEIIPVPEDDIHD